MANKLEEAMKLRLVQKRESTFLVDKSLFREDPPFPREIYIDTLNRCNHKCYFCSNPKMKNYKVLDADRVHEIMRQARLNGTTDLALFAHGEPLSDKRMPSFISQAKRLGYPYVFLVSNGSLAVPKIIKPILDAGLDSIKFSINAFTREEYKVVHGKDDFNKVIKNLKWIFDYRNENNLSLGIYVSCVKNSKSSPDEELVEKTFRSFCDNFDFRNISNQGGTMTELNATETIEAGNILGSLHKREITGHCVYPFNRMVVNAYGHVTACTADFLDRLWIGDTQKHTLAEIWLSDKYRYFRRRHLCEDYKGLNCDACIRNLSDKCRNNSLNDTTTLEEAYRNQRI